MFHAFMMEYMLYMTRVYTETRNDIIYDKFQTIHTSRALQNYKEVQK
jgi:hypothetical protein